ncbi:MAG: hypothetical protein H6707_01780 [Deltaproteobacteria bacterium]|nr:hypothetical protein [Deltaproteobacteria bacterium]
METEEKLQRMLWWEFLSNAELLKRARLDDLVVTLAQEVSQQRPQLAVKELLSSPLLEALSYQRLKGAVAVRDMTLISKTPATLATELRSDGADYDGCCDAAVLFLVANKPANAQSALRVAASLNPSRTRHHYLGALLYALGDDVVRAMELLDQALAGELYDAERVRVHRLMDCLGVERSHPGVLLR